VCIAWCVFETNNAVDAAPLCREIMTVLQENSTDHTHRYVLNLNADMTSAGLLML
jgi:hypothetical protein